PSCYPHAAEGLLPPQFSNYSEDCLTLNVMRPSRISSQSNLPVLVWVHGGGYEVGSAVLYGYKDLTDIYIPHDIIVVTIQYRLGFLGFLSTGDASAPGNMGLFDQALAIKWLYENIESFGGDKSRIRVWGLSAGGASVSQLSISPYTNEYVNGSFEMSGTALSNWALGKEDDLVANSKLLGMEVGCSDNIKSCLKKKTIDQMFEAVTKTVGYKGEDVVLLKFSPRIDGDFFPAHPDVLIKNAKRKPVSIIGVGEKEDSFFILHGLAPYLHNIAVPKEEWPNFNRQKFIETIEKKVVRKSDFGDSASFVRDQIVDFYGKGAKNDDDYLFYLNQYNMLMSDLHFAVGATRTILKKAEEGWPVYAYSFEHYNKKLFETLPEQLRGSTHTNEYPYMFNIFIFGKYDIDSDPQEVAVKNLFRNSLLSFVKNGQPQPGADTDWPSVAATDSAKDIKFIRFLPQPSIGKGLHHEAYDFWMNLKQKVPFDLVEFKKTSVRDEL
ncbi:hypothetical protein WR25_25186 isoform A, partial [Diploscapter pachys]